MGSSRSLKRGALAPEITFGRLAKCPNVSFSLQGAVNGCLRVEFAGRASFPTCTKKPERMAPVGDWDVTLVQRSAARGL